ncbi:N-acetylglucosaminyldiphosphoundecaprenol N-acetyl-beta-D-mannosaminyltransferase [Butyrivibrio fibrisolvens]|uniref:N-acetylglucosaminyldiphosphoundecaprenol N-acetyl-beta-D-mannosaminyltransferase n=1 Tax=Butyrivibrio fibrisolvens TaxID=831 RepID=A0A1H9WVP0_BUTFI|nr:WecB/TagA/CpsF family glycosyltransferase [Butyrivibrio fibrisolvens]SES37986.1 N-acetylglucosaminyldiphosphoundecaprenol N-acetyl-beta-D-mannosaminyltransferase [Butyrivibrio fibrisolvens]
MYNKTDNDMELNTIDIFGIRYAIASMTGAVVCVKDSLESLKGRYICFSNVHTTVMAREHSSFRDILNGAAYVFADGNPIATYQKRRGFLYAERVAGPDFMSEMFGIKGISHYFYGSSERTLQKLKSNLEREYPGIVIKGLYSPPYRELTQAEDIADVDRINAAGADIVWIGLGAPKQEKWMYAHQGKINGVMMGVGAGFDFHASTIKRAPKWIQKIGFEWLYRIFQDPKRLVKRYMITNSKYIYYLIKDRLI